MTFLLIASILTGAKLRKKVVKNNGFWKINAIRPVIKAIRGRTGKFKFGLKANWGELVKELGFLFVTQFMSLEPSIVTTQNGEEWGTFYRQFLIPQTATFCIATEPRKDSSFAVGFSKTSKKHEQKHIFGTVLREQR